MKKLLLASSALLMAPALASANSNEVHYSGQGYGNSFSAYQSGSGNTIGAEAPYWGAYYSVPSDYAAGQQVGDSNRADIRQTGTSNAVTFNQGSDKVYGYRGYSYGSTDTGYRNILDTDQYGTSNVASTWQSGNYNYARQYQSGSNNASHVNQYGDSDRVSGSQSGVSNSVVVRQGADRNGPSYRVVTYTQSGSDNVLRTNQNDGYGTYNFGTQTITSNQYGNGNDAYLDQVGGNSAYLFQSGNDNFADVDQQSVFAGRSGTYAHTANVRQYGDYNRATVNQSGGTSSGNDAYVTQTGDRNNSSIRQTGSEGFVRLTQTGDSNSFSITQGGYGNSVSLAMVGNGGRISLSQY